MMKTFILLMLCTATLCHCASTKRDLIDTLQQLNVSSFLRDLALDQQLLLVDLIEHGDNGTLTKFIDDIGYVRVLEILHALSASDEMTINTYLINHLTAEAAGPVNAHHGVAIGSSLGK